MIARFTFDLMGPAQPFWLSAPQIALGGPSAEIGALRAKLEEDTKVLLACSTIENVALIAIGLGLALALRGADLPALQPRKPSDSNWLPIGLVLTAGIVLGGLALLFRRIFG